MVKTSKRISTNQEKLEPGKHYNINEALQLLKDCAKVKFDETVEVAVNLGIDPRKSDQSVQSSIVLPQGTGKTVKVAVFTQGAKAKDAEAAGAEYVGMGDLAERIQNGLLDFGVVIATSDAMPIRWQVG